MTDEQPPAAQPLPGIEIAVAPMPEHPSGVPVVMARFTADVAAVEVHVKDGKAVVFLSIDARQATAFAQALAGGIAQGAQVALAAKPQIITPDTPGFAAPGGLNGANPHEVLRQRNGRRPV